MDGVAIATLPRKEIRRRVVSVSQQPFLLKGSVRLNAYPIGATSDNAITAALQCVQVMELVSKNGGFDTDIDSKTEETIQRLIRRKFASHTIISVAHRLDTIMDFDKVAVTDSGRIVEVDDPYALLDMPESAFAKLYRAELADDGDV